MGALTWCAIGFWLICGVFAWGASFAWFQRADGTFTPEFQRSFRNKDLAFSVSWGLLGGPVSALMALLTSGCCKHGWRLR